ncbi:PREDICTED: uncharacterized protein LOC108358777 [Rhagoletis zephyria]|uniref:uncharacterized protein LOC108358777 n=1 Tax=Rhagoletis zephyria TaxID=28612 RepID=UPI000811694F|nr:PREDICTED: uncharacterized protein LOC108358777 [Rhagoletis zephyria]
MPVKVFQKMSLNEELNPENREQNLNITAGSPEQNEDVHDASYAPQVTRELTQTDRINKHLLKSFLERINATGQIMEHFSTQSPQPNSSGNESDDFEEQLFIGTEIM